MVPDLRFGKSKAGSREKSFAVDAFFATLHHRVAETLPDRPLVDIHKAKFLASCCCCTFFEQCSRDYFGGIDA